jgi:uncharacterized membrane protein YbaN (DUF454 family)
MEKGFVGDGPSKNAAGRTCDGLWHFDLPPNASDDDGHLHAAATRLLSHSTVRSVTIDHRRRRAAVRVRQRRHDQLSFSYLRQVLHGTDAGYSDSAAEPALVSWTDAASQSVCYIKLPPVARGWQKWLLLTVAAVTLVVGLIGVVLPGVPTTPFVLVASYCLLRASPQLHEKLLMSRLFGGVLRDWHLHRGIRPHVRYKAIAVVVLVVAASLLLTNLPLAAKLAIAAVATLGVCYVWRLPNVVEPAACEETSVCILSEK